MLSAQEWRQQALDCRDAQDMAAAHDAIEWAARTAPNDPLTAFIRAQIALETGRPAAALFARAVALNPGNQAVVRNHAAALAEEGQIADATALLERALAAEPTWLDGHKLLASLRVTMSGGDDFAASYIAACRRAPESLPLRLAWFQALALARDWHGARRVVDVAIMRFGEVAALRSARAYIASESGSGGLDPALFDDVADVADPGLDLARVRHMLRRGEALAAAAVAERHIGTPTAATFWPYLSIIWRLLDDPRADWLDGVAPIVARCDLTLDADALTRLAEILNGLHAARAPYLEQSVRGGTQTSGQLFFRHEPEIQTLRRTVTAAIERYVADLPAFDSSHPLLGPPRDRPVRFAGSWSVRLGEQGHHSRHTHTHGWISSALYVALPPSDAMGPKPAGWFDYGAPPKDLMCDLPGYGQIAPCVGQLLLFPSTLWHGTIPFESGTRLTVAFDVGIPHP